MVGVIALATVAACGAKATHPAGPGDMSEAGTRYECPPGSAHDYYTEHDGGAYYRTDTGRKVTTAGELANICK